MPLPRKRQQDSLGSLNFISNDLIAFKKPSQIFCSLVIVTFLEPQNTCSFGYSHSGICFSCLPSRPMLELSPYVY